MHKTHKRYQMTKNRDGTIEKQTVTNKDGYKRSLKYQKRLSAWGSCIGEVQALYLCVPRGPLSHLSMSKDNEYCWVCEECMFPANSHLWNKNKSSIN